MNKPVSDGAPILFDHDAHLEEQSSGAQIIDFTAHRLGAVRRVLSHEVIYADNDDDEFDDEFDMALIAGMRFR